MMTKASEKALKELKAHYAKIDACFWQCEQWARRCKLEHSINIWPDSIHLNISKRVKGVVNRDKEVAIALDEFAQIIDKPEHIIERRLVSDGVMFSIPSAPFKFQARPWFFLTFADMPMCQSIEVPQPYTITKYICS